MDDNLHLLYKYYQHRCIWYQSNDFCWGFLRRITRWRALNINFDKRRKALQSQFNWQLLHDRAVFKQWREKCSKVVKWYFNQLYGRCRWPSKQIWWRWGFLRDDLSKRYWLKWKYHKRRSSKWRRLVWRLIVRAVRSNKRSYTEKMMFIS